MSDSDRARERWFPGIGGTEVELYGWVRCSHEGIGKPGCRICDPDKARVANRYEFLLAVADLDRQKWKGLAELHLEMAERAQDGWNKAIDSLDAAKAAQRDTSAALIEEYASANKESDARLTPASLLRLAKVIRKAGGK